MVKEIKQQELKTDKPYGILARRLRLSSFFRAPAVWKAIGTENTFKFWLEMAPCCICSKKNISMELIKIPFLNEPCCLIANDKSADALSDLKCYSLPKYYYLPICPSCHLRIFQSSHETINKPRLKHLRLREKWGWETLKKSLGYESWAQIPPKILCEWAIEHQVQNYLPEDYKKYLLERHRDEILKRDGFEEISEEEQYRNLKRISKIIH